MLAALASPAAVVGVAAAGAAAVSASWVSYSCCSGGPRDEWWAGAVPPRGSTTEVGEREPKPEFFCLLQLSTWQGLKRKERCGGRSLVLGAIALDHGVSAVG